jgi:nucleoside-diphosphate-sugar epimerase
MHLFCFGLGYTSLNLARKLKQQGWNISGTCRSLEKQRELKREGIQAFLFSEPDLKSLNNATHVLVSIPPFEDAGDIVLEYFESALLNAPQIKWLGYLSTTGVYGDCGGAWVDETTIPTPHSVRTKRRLDVERQWFDLYQSKNLPVHIFRLAGIYGKDRNALLGILDGSARVINKAGQVFSRIHVDDIAGILHASMLKPTAGECYNVGDDHPCSAMEVQQFAAELLGKPSPEIIPYEQAILSIMQREFYSANRRVSNAKVKRELAYNLLYPTYKEGLTALARDL